MDDFSLLNLLSVFRSNSPLQSFTPLGHNFTTFALWKLCYCCAIKGNFKKKKKRYSLSAFKCHKSNIKNLLMKSSEIVLIFLPAFYLIIWLMKSLKNFEKISFLKIWQMVFFWGAKIYFGKFLLKWSIFRSGKIWFSQIMPFNSYHFHLM